MQRLIYIPLLVVALLAATVLLVLKLRSPHCDGLVFSVPSSGRADERVAFTDSTAKAASWLWDFGDSTDQSSDRSPSHRYAQPGKYIVSLTVNQSCQDLKQIEILPKPAMQLQLAQIQGPSGEVYIGDQVPFNELTPDATDWEWTFGESGKVDKRTKQTAYAFHTPGYKTVTVYVTTPGGKLSGTYSVNVKERSLDIKPQMITPKEIAGAGKPTGAAKKNLFMNKLAAFLMQEDLSSRTKIFTELQQYVCNNTIPVLWITPKFHKDKKKNFEDFCREIMSDKNIYEIKSISGDFDDAKDCVSSVRVEMKAK